jgi:hypothetical protein
MGWLKVARSGTAASPVRAAGLFHADRIAASDLRSEFADVQPRADPD